MDEYISAVLTALSAINGAVVAIHSAMEATQEAMHNLHYMIEEIDVELFLMSGEDDDAPDGGVGFHSDFNG